MKDGFVGVFLYYHQQRASDKLDKRIQNQLVRLVQIKLLEQICGLLGDEELELKEFADILDAGFAEIKVGTIPQNVDKVALPVFSCVW